MRLDTLRLAGLAFAVMLIGCRQAVPPIDLQPSPTGLRVSVQTLGEYKTSISKVRITDGVTTVWEVTAPSGSVQIHEFPLQAGVNNVRPGDLSWEGFVVSIPQSASGFRLEPGREYVLEVFGEDAAAGNSARFRLH